MNELYRRANVDAELHVWGCSFAWGMGIEETLTWPRLVSQALGVTLANWGIQGASPRRVWHCYQELRNKVKPRLTIIAWPTLNRDWVNGRNMGQWNRHLDPVFDGRLISGQVQQENQALIKWAKSQIQEPVIHFSVAGLWPTLEFPDSAEDGLHPGPMTHQKIADYLLLTAKAPLLLAN